MSETLEQPQTFSIEKLQAAQLPELQGLKEKQMQIVKENPFIEITDNTTFEVAKKSRTNLVSARTDIEKQDKAIASKIKKFREMVSGVSEELISITRPHEEKQQEEVKRYEAEKEAEKLEKQRIENERIAKIKSAIDSIYNSYVTKIQNLTFDLIQTLEVDFEQNLKKTETLQFEEFELDFNEKLMMLDNQFSSKKIALQEKEAQRIEAENLKIEREKLKADRKALDAEKATIVKAESDKKAQELKDALAAKNDRIATEKANEVAKIKAKKQEALKPEKEKAVDFLNCLVFKNDLPEITDSEIINHLQAFMEEIDQQRNDLIKFIQNL